MYQKAKELGALPNGLVRPGEVFEWPTLEPWAVELTPAEVREHFARDRSEPIIEEDRGTAVSVTPGKSEVVTGPPRRGRPAKAVTQ